MLISSRTMPAKIFGVTMPQYFTSLGPALMISMGYINLGKWVTIVEGGARFGFDLGLLLVIFNATAIMCQYLAACIGTVSGKNLAEICSEEYCKPVCILLGVQAELSMITTELTTVLGMAYGLGLLFGVDLLTCVLFITVGAVLLRLLMTLLGNYKTELLCIGMAGFGLLFYVFGVLISQPEIPLTMNMMFPKFSGDNVYSLMALLGANIMSHNFYIHSSLVQEQSRTTNISIGTLFHDHFFAILIIFTGIFLVNHVLMNSVAAVFSSADAFVLNFEDVSLLMDQGVIEPAFLKPRDFRKPCSCLEIPSPHNSVLLATEKTSKNITSAGMVLEIIKDVEAAVSGRKGRTGTAAGDVAFPKGKENLASVLKRYKRRLLNKPQGTQESTPSRRPRTPASTLL